MCRRIFESQAATRKGELAETQLRLEDDCFATLIGMWQRGEDNDNAVNVALSRFGSMGLNDTAGVYGKFFATRRINQVRAGQFPILTDTGLALHPSEVAHYVFPSAALFQRQVVGQKLVGQSAGITLFDAGMAFSFGGNEGTWTNVVGDVHLGTGQIILTSQRFVFSSPTTGLNTAWLRMLSISTIPGGFQIVTDPGNGVGVARFFRCADSKFICYCCLALRASPQADYFPPDRTIR
jgi:hypothetical protein